MPQMGCSKQQNREYIRLEARSAESRTMPCQRDGSGHHARTRRPRVFTWGKPGASNCLILFYFDAGPCSTPWFGRNASVDLGSVGGGKASVFIHVDTDVCGQCVADGVLGTGCEPQHHAPRTGPRHQINRGGPER